LLGFRCLLRWWLRGDDRVSWRRAKVPYKYG
jgi:hypothetical protein